mmetsp:Transcript_78444/g.243272  ORF Transcript_78444/g.243272 Transcript_78444/m.243272 type:complete len:538 (+) Transcript_78444:79-1692(+)
MSTSSSDEKPQKPEPTKASSAGLAGIVKVVVNTFLEKKHFRQLHETLSDQWSGCHSLTAAVRLMEAHSVSISQKEKEHLAALPEDRMIDALVTKMPQQSREQFEHFFLQLSFIASTTTRLRTALEAGLVDAIEDALESAENVGVLPYIMQMAVAQAGEMVKTQRSKHASWLAEMDTRMKPLLDSQAKSMTTQKELVAKRKEVEAATTQGKDKSAATLICITSGNTKVLLSMSFVAWMETAKKMKEEAAIRKEYEEEITKAHKQLMEYKAAQLANVKKVLNRTSAESNITLISNVVNALKSEAKSIQTAREAKAEMSALDQQLKSFSETSAKNAKNVMARVSAGSDEGLRATAFNGWAQYFQNYKKDKEMNDAVRAAEMKVESFMKKQKDGAKSVLQRMQQASTSGLISSVFQAWSEAVDDAKQEQEMESALHAKSSKLTAFSNRNKGSAKNASHRKAQLEEQSMLILAFLSWVRIHKCERMIHFGKEKTNKRKQELTNVKGLFKKFATELEGSLQEGTPRVEKRQGRSARVEGQPSP